MINFVRLGLNPSDVGAYSTHPFVQAIQLAERGATVVPMGSRGELLGQPTRDPEELTALHIQHPNANWVAPCGRKFGLVVLDFRSENEKSLGEYLHELGPLPTSWTVTRPGGGLHRWFGRDTIGSELAATLALDRFVEIKKFAPVPGSINKKTGSKYVWMPNAAPGVVPLARLPANWLWALPKKTASISASRVAADAPPEFDVTKTASWRRIGG